MSIRFSCPTCRERITIDDDTGGTKIRCPQCKTLIAVPKPPAKKKREEAIQVDRKLAVKASRTQTGNDEEAPRPRSAKKKEAAKSGFSLVLLAVAALVLVPCLLAGVGGVAWFVLRDPQQGNNDAQAKLNGKKANDENKAEKPLLKDAEKEKEKSAPIGKLDEKKDPNPLEKKTPVNLAGVDFNIAQVRKSVVFVKRITPGLITATGSGFLATKDGLIYTNRHVAVPDDVNVAGAMLFVGVPSAKDPDLLDYFKAELVYAPPEADDLDFAILKIIAKPDYGELNALTLSAVPLGLGAPAAAVGYPAITDDTPPLSFNKGSISATRVKFGERTFYQTDAAVNPGNSGGPLINAKGEVVGIVTLKKRDAVNMGYALYLSEITKAVTTGIALAPKFAPEAGPMDPKKKLPTLPAIAAKKANWHINRGEVIEGKSFMEIDANGGAYWLTSKESLPANFQLVIPCQIMGLQGSQVLQPSQFSVLRTLAVRFGTDETDAMILEPKGYMIRFSHNFLVLNRDGIELKRSGKGNTTFPFNYIITKLGNKITIAVDDKVLMEHIDDDPISGAGPFSIGGYTSRLRLGGVSIIKLGDDLVAKGDKKDNKTDPKKEDDRPIPVGGIANPPPKELHNGDVTMRLFNFAKKKTGNFSSDVVWAKDGKSFYTLQEFGLLQRINVVTGHTEQFTELSFKCGNMAMSGEGLLVVGLGGQLCVINPDKLDEVVRKISVPGISQISSGVDAKIAWAGTPNSNRRGFAMQAVDLREGKLLKKHERFETWRFAVSPDGKYIFNADDGGMSRFRVIDDDDLVREQRSYQLGGNRSRNLCFSPDSRFVAMPTGGGNDGGNPDHPVLRGGTIYVYPVNNLRKPATAYAPGGHPNGIGIDPKSGCVLAHSGDGQLLVYSFSADFKMSEHRFKSLPRVSIVELNVSPYGSEAIIRSEEQNLFHVKINKAGPPIDKVITVETEATTIDNPAPVEIAKGELDLRHLTFRQEKAGNIRHGIIWAKDGKSFFMLQENGLLQRVNVATGKTEQYTELGERCGNISLSGEGLLVSLTEAGELRVLNPDKLGDLRKKISIPKIGHIASGVDASIAWVAVSGEARGTRPAVQAVDLKTGQFLSTHAKHNLLDFAVTPDGKYLFGRNQTELIRFRIDKDDLIQEEKSYEIAWSTARAICISPDSKYVALPNPQGGNGVGYPDHPELSKLATYIYPVGNLKRPISAHVSGRFQKSVGIDPKTGSILAMNDDSPLIVYNFAVDTKIGQYDFKTHRGFSAEFAVSPLGSEVIVRTEANGIIHAKINKGGPPVEQFLATDFSKTIATPFTGTKKNPDPIGLANGDVTLRQLIYTHGVASKIQSIVWAKDGNTFFMLHANGILQRINVASGTTEQYLEINHPCTNLAMSGEGLLVTVAGANQLWVIEPEHLANVKKKIFLPTMIQIASGVDASIAWVSVLKGMLAGPLALQAVDLKEGKPLGTNTKYDLSMFVVSADGKYLVTFDQGHLTRYRIDKEDLIQEETSFMLSKLGERRIVVSPDGKYVAMPLGRGNVPGHPDHPAVKGNPTYIYSIGNLKRPVAVYTTTSFRNSLGIDPKSGTLMVADSSIPLKLYSFAVNTNIGTHYFKPIETNSVEFFVSPRGSEAIALTINLGMMIHIKLNKAGPPIEKVGSADIPRIAPGSAFFRAHLLEREQARNEPRFAVLAR